MNVDLKTLRSSLVLPALTSAQLDTLERIKRLEAMTTKSLGKGIGARQWLREIAEERAARKRGSR